MASLSSSTSIPHSNETSGFQQQQQHLNSTSNTTSTPLTSNIASNANSHSLCALLTWKDPVHTGKVFGSILLTLTVFKTINLFNIFFHLAYIGLLISAAAEYSGKLIIGKGFLENYKPTTKSYAECFNKNALPNLAQFNVEIESTLKKIVYSHDIELTLKAAGISYILYKLTSFVSLFTLITISVVLIFTGPFVYTTYKKEIDAFIAQLTKTFKSKSSEVYENVHKSAGPHIDAFIKKTGPVGQFVQSKFPVRTAGSTVGDSKATTYGSAADKSSTSTTKSTGATASTTGYSTSDPSSSFGQSTGHTTGASQFPTAPTSGLHPTTVEDAIHNAQAESEEFADTTQGSFK